MDNELTDDLSTPVWIQFRRAKNDEWFWRALARNREVLARSSETYERFESAQHCCVLVLGPTRFQALADAGYVTIIEDPEGED